MLFYYPPTFSELSPPIHSESIQLCSILILGYVLLHQSGISLSGYHLNDTFPNLQIKICRTRCFFLEFFYVQPTKAVCTI